MSAPEGKNAYLVADPDLLRKTLADFTATVASSSRKLVLELMAAHPAHQAFVVALERSKDGKTLKVCAWAIPTGEEAHAYAQALDSDVYSNALVTDRARMAAANEGA